MRALPRPARVPILLALVASAPAPAASAQSVEPAPLDGFDRYVAAAAEDWGATGLAVAVVKDDELVFSSGYGVREAGRTEPVDPATLFAIGSTTKAMTAAAVGMLVDEGALDWDDPVIDHLPWFRLADPWMTAEVTVRDLLTHRAGLGNADLLWYGRPDRQTEDIVRALRYVEPAYSLRSGFIYQNIMYAAAGEVVEAVSGMPWEAFVRRRIFEPLGMARTVPTLAEARQSDNVASPHDEIDGRVGVIQNAAVDPVAPAGSVWSSVDDMSRWLRFLLRGCETPDGTALLEPRTCEELFTPQTVLPEPPYPTARLVRPHWTTYGLGWFQQDYEGRKVDFHTGSIDGMVAIAGLIRDEDLGVYVLANRDHVEVRHALMYRVFDLFDDGEPRDWSADLKELYDGLAAARDSAAAARRVARVEGPGPSLPLEAYAGTWSHPAWGEVEVTLSEGTLRLAMGAREAVLEHRHHDTFEAVWTRRNRGRTTLTFVLDASGTAARLEFAGVELRRRE
ncbi:MAG: serine hydrolase [Gemmatimonadota bacterium]|jgi:CubicO group peptidase (beta-lactamase class C family)